MAIVYEFVRNEAFNARNYFESSVPPYHKNDFGYTLGGPIFIPGHYNTDKHEDLLLLVAGMAQGKCSRTGVQCPRALECRTARELQRPVLQSRGMGAIPTARFSRRPTILSQQQVPIIPSEQISLPLIPMANAGVPGAALYNASPTQPTNWREELLRIDQNFGSKVRAMFRYTHDSWNTVTPTTVFTGSTFPRYKPILSVLR